MLQNLTLFCHHEMKVDKFHVLWVKGFFFSIFFYCFYSIHFKFLMELADFWNYPTHRSKFYKNLDCSWLRKRAKSSLLIGKQELFSHTNTKSINMETFRLKVGLSSYLIIAWKIHFFSHLFLLPTTFWLLPKDNFLYSHRVFPSHNWE